MLHKLIMCAVGLHKWKYTKAVYENEFCERHGIPLLSGTRKCECCGKLQFEDRHLLGMNPQEYVVTWYNYNPH